MRKPACALLVLSAMLLCVAGCGGTDVDESADGKKGKEKETVKIDPVAGKLDPLDDGRIVVPLPAKWISSNNEEEDDKSLDKNLARIRQEGALMLPAIMIRVREYAEFKTLGEPDLRKFVRSRGGEVAKERGFKSKLDVKPLSLNGFHGGEYAYTAKIGTKRYERLVLETVVDSRMYTLELTTVNGLREASRPALYAVATKLQFPKMVNKPTGGRRSRSDADEDAPDDEADAEPKADGEKADEVKGDKTSAEDSAADDKPQGEDDSSADK